MQRVISLFKEADDGYPGPEIEQDEYGDAEQQPLYFVQLLNYLHEQKESDETENLRAGAD